MKRTPPGTAGSSEASHDTILTQVFSTELPPPQLPPVIDLPVDSFHPRPMRKSERSLVVACWWAMRREGVKLPAERGVILIDGGKS